MTAQSRTVRSFAARREGLAVRAERDGLDVPGGAYQCRDRPGLPCRRSRSRAGRCHSALPPARTFRWD